MEIAGYFRLSNEKAVQMVKEISTVVKDWRKIAHKYKISNAEQERMSTAFLPQ